MWIDAHAHFYGFSDAECAQALGAARLAQVMAIVDAGVDCASSCLAARRAQKHAPLLWACVGVSPFDVAGLSAAWIGDIAALAQTPRVIGIGEIGLDAANPRYPGIEVQLPALRQQLTLAAKLSLPAVLHSRGAESRVLSACLDAGVVKALFHCYTGSLDDVRRILDAGYYVSFSGIVTFCGSRLDLLVRYAPLDRLLIETDTPYLAPYPHRGAKNQPAWVAEVGKKVAQIKGCSTETLGQRICANFAALFGVDPLIAER